MTTLLTDRLAQAWADYIEADGAYLNDPSRRTKKLTLEFFINGPDIELRAAPETVRKTEKRCG